MPASRPAALIVDDQPFVGLVASDILRESGFQTFHACDATDATALLAEHPEIAVMVADADLAGDVTGLELCQRVSRERPYIQLVVTASGQDVAEADIPFGRARTAQALRQRGTAHPRGSKGALRTGLS